MWTHFDLITGQYKITDLSWVSTAGMWLMVPTFSIKKHIRLLFGSSRRQVWVTDSSSNHLTQMNQMYNISQVKLVRKMFLITMHLIAKTLNASDKLFCPLITFDKTHYGDILSTSSFFSGPFVGGQSHYSLLESFSSLEHSSHKWGWCLACHLCSFYIKAIVFKLLIMCCCIIQSCRCFFFEGHHC